MLASDVHLENAHPPIWVTEAEISTLTSEVQSENALSPIHVTEFGIVMLVSEPQPENALSPIVVKEAGIIISLISLSFLQLSHLLPDFHTLNASLAIAATASFPILSGIETTVSSPL